jgi:hypothetical protein
MTSICERFEFGMAMVVEWDMTLCTSEIRLISLYIKYLYGLLVQRGHVETILMDTISARKKTEYLNCFSHAVELLWMCN